MTVVRLMIQVVLEVHGAMKNIKPLTFSEVMIKCEEIVNAEYKHPSFFSYYVTDNDCKGTKEKPYAIKCLCSFPLIYCNNKNNKFTLSEEQKLKYKQMLIWLFDKEKIYLL